jgi:uncharacterized GH25 family protein
MKKYALPIIVCFTLVMAGQTAQAHMLWLTPEKAAAAAGEPIRITIGFGHHFSPEEVMEKEDRLERVYAVAPDGREIDAQPVNPSTYIFTPDKEGAYAIYAAMKSGFMSTTTTGRKMGNKQTLDGVLSCFAFKMAAMTSVSRGTGSGANFSGKALDLEIIPQKDPKSVKVGDSLPLLVMFQGAPLADAEVGAVGANSKKEKDQDWDQQVKTDAKGMANIAINVDGAWLFSVRHKIPYAVADICDDSVYSTTVTLNF